MAKKKTFEIGRSIGQALSETVSAAKHYSGELNIDVVPLRKIELDPENPRDLVLTFTDLYNELSKEDIEYERKVKEKETLKTLANSIKEQGVLNPIIVYKFGEKYRLIAGERRTLASILCGQENIQARVWDGKPSQLTLSLLQWIENVERTDLTLWERLRNIEKITSSIVAEGEKTIENITATTLSQTLGCSFQHASNYKNALGASSKLKMLIKNNQIRNLEKVSLISCAPIDIQDKLMDACLNRATLKELKKLAEIPTKVLKERKQEKRGRQAACVNFGVTKNIHVAKTIIDSILENKQFFHIKDSLSKIKWDDFSSVAEAFKIVIKAIEQQTK